MPVFPPADAMFENPEIPLDALPGTDNLDWQAIDPRHVRQQRIVRMSVLGAVGVVATAANLLPDVIIAAPLLIWGVALLLSAPVYWWPRLAWSRRGFVVRDKDIVCRGGVVWHKVTAIPFNRIQHVETSSTPLDRRFGLAALQIFTAGGSGADLRIEGLEAGLAERLRAHILKKTGSAVEHD